MNRKKQQNEAALVCSARKGDKKALRTVLERNWNWLRGLVWGIVKSAEATDDVMQDVCIRVISKIDTLREPEMFRSWLGVIARREAFQYYRKKNRSEDFKEELIQKAYEQRSIGVPEAVGQAEQYQLALKELALLPQKYREVFMLKYSDELSYAQIAEILSIPITTVQIRLYRSRRMLYERLVGNKEKLQED